MIPEWVKRLSELKDEFDPAFHSSFEDFLFVKLVKAETKAKNFEGKYVTMLVQNLIDFAEFEPELWQNLCKDNPEDIAKLRLRISMSKGDF